MVDYLPDKTYILTSYKDSLNKAATWSEFLSRLTLKFASHDLLCSSPITTWTKKYTSNIHYAYIFLGTSRNYDLIQKWHTEQGISERECCNNIRVEILSRDNKDASWLQHTVTIKDLSQHSLRLDEATYLMLRVIIQQAYTLPKRLSVSCYNNQEMIEAYRTARSNSINLRMFLLNLIDRFAVLVNGVYQPKYIKMNYHNGYLMFLDLIDRNGMYTYDIKGDLIKWHRENLMYPTDVVETCVLIINSIP